MRLRNKSRTITSSAWKLHVKHTCLSAASPRTRSITSAADPVLSDSKSGPFCISVVLLQRGLTEAPQPLRSRKDPGQLIRVARLGKLKVGSARQPLEQLLVSGADHAFAPDKDNDSQSQQGCVKHF